MKNTIIILQARADSQRFPDKVLRTLQDIPMLSHCIRRLKNIHPLAKLIVATSVLPANDRIEQLAKEEGVPCFRGSEDDVLDRFYQTAVKFKANFIVRATGVNPLVDPEEAKRVIREVLTGQWDYVCGFEEVEGLVLPKGVGVEIFSFNTLQTIWQHAKLSKYREHINDYVFDNEKQFRVKYLACQRHNHCPGLNLSVDTIEDFRFIEHIGENIRTPLLDCSAREVIEFFKDS